MRREDMATGPDRARELLRSAGYGILSMASAEGVPYGIPLNYAFEDDCLYFHCAPEGRKTDFLSGNGKVSFCVVGRTRVLPREFTTEYESAVARGYASELHGQEKKLGLELLVRKYSPGHLEKGLECIDRLINSTRVFRIRLDSITGKASG